MSNKQTGMMLFYCTFTAMKRQDSQPVPHDRLLDDFETLGQDERKEESLKCRGIIKHGELRHAIRLYRDHASGVVRLEATALRGPMAVSSRLATDTAITLIEYLASVMRS